MPQKQELTWSELRVGSFRARRNPGGDGGHLLRHRHGLSGRQVSAGDLSAGSGGLDYRRAKVTLDGVEVGNVDSIQMARPKPGEPPNAKRSVEVVMRVSRDFQNDIRTDSTAALLTEGFLGDRVVTLQRGYTGVVLQDGQEIPGAEEKSLNEIMANGADLMQNLNALVEASWRHRRRHSARSRDARRAADGQGGVRQCGRRRSSASTR